MKLNSAIPTAAVAVALFMAISPAWSAGAPKTPSTQNGISYVSGGVGEDDEEAMRAVAAEYNLKLSFAESITGAYLSGVKVTVQDTKGNTLLDTVSDGPCLFASMPAGTYKVTAESGGKSVVRTAHLAAKRGLGMHLYWSEPAAKEEIATEKEEMKEEEKTGHGIHGCW